MFSDDRCRQIILRSIEVGEEQAKEEFSLNHESFGRYKRHFKSISPGILEKIEQLENITKTFSEKEITAISQSGKGRKHEYINEAIDFSGDKIKYAQITDTHIGHIDCDKRLLSTSLKIAEDSGCQFIIHTGDVTEGMSSRPGHVYELEHIGYKAQLEASYNAFRDCKLPIYAIDGNHDRWFIKACGAWIVEDIARELSNFNYLGSDFATLEVGGIKIGLWHGEDGNSYAYSYRIQKVVEALNTKQLPDILHAGHTHKYDVCMPREIFAISGGSICRQTPWMRGKRIEAHVGFNIMELTVNTGKIVRCNHEFYRG